MTVMRRLLWAIALSIAVLGGDIAYADFKQAALAFRAKNWDVAFKAASAAAAQGDIRAQAMLGYLYFHGRGAERNINTALDWYNKAASKGHNGARFDLGKIYARGTKGLPKDYEKSKLYFKQAADAGHVPAQFNLGIVYTATAKDDNDNAWKHAAYWFGQAAAKGNPLAQYSLGALYMQGKGVPKNMVTAAAWILKAAQKKHPPAEVDYALMVFRGDGVQKNEKVAAQWLTNAARRNNVVAQNRLARLLIAGKGIKQDLVEAAKWHLLSKNAGLKDPKLDQLIAKLSKQERAEAERRVENWYLLYPRRRPKAKPTN